MTKAQARKQFDGSTGLFNACWRQYLHLRQHADVDDVLELLDQLASLRVNNPKSRFYIYG